MRANPIAEGQRLASTSDPNVLSAYASFMVDLNLMQAELATNSSVPPLAMNAKLTAAARWHSGDMFTNQYQGHYQTNGSVVLSPDDRIRTNGYQASVDGENVFAHADSVFYGHAGFAVDWGGSPASGGMQDPPGHRENMLSALFREVGMGVVDGVNGTVGPQLVTQDFGTQLTSSPFITGVVYFDLNGNGFYDLGEGIGGVMVNTPGSAYFAVTADSGGYAIPVTTNGSYTLTFTASGLSNQVVAMVSGLHNAKVDYTPVYSPPVISGPNPALLNQSNVYSFTAVPAATAYQWQQTKLSAYTLVEQAQNGLSNVSVVSSPGYSVITNDPTPSGNLAFNLSHVGPDPTDQSITLNPVVLVNANSQLSFAELLGYGFSNEVAQAQVAVDGGSSWQTLWSKAGNDGTSSVDSVFVNQTISLGTYAGHLLQVRFLYAYQSGFYYPPQPGAGLYLNNIAISNAQQVSGMVTNNVASGRSFSFSPATPTNYLLEVRAQINSRTLPWGPALQVSVSAAAAPTGIQLLAQPMVSGNQVKIDFSVTNYRAGMTFQLLKTADLQGTWTADTSASLQTLTPNSTFRFTTSTGAATRMFFKVKGT